MMELALIIAIGYFVATLVLRSTILRRLCALCASVTLTWLTLLVLRFTGIVVDSAILAVLMGGSAVGLLYYLSAYLPARFHVFKLAFLLTLLAIVYYIASLEPLTLVLVVVLGILWLFSLVLFYLREKDSMRSIVGKVIECCRNW